MRNKKATCLISCRADVTATFSAAFKAGSLRSKTFVFRGLSQYDSPAIYMLSGANSSTIAIWRIERWRIVKKPCKRMLKWCSFFAFFGNVLIFVVPLHMWKWRVKSEKWRITMRNVWMKGERNDRNQRNKPCGMKVHLTHNSSLFTLHSSLNLLTV